MKMGNYGNCHILVEGVTLFGKQVVISGQVEHHVSHLGIHPEDYLGHRHQETVEFSQTHAFRANCLLKHQHWINPKLHEQLTG